MGYQKLKKSQLLQELTDRDNELHDKSTELDTLKAEHENLSREFTENTVTLKQAEDKLKILGDNFDAVSSDLDKVTEIELRESQYVKILCTALGIETVAIIVMLLILILS